MKTSVLFCVCASIVLSCGAPAANAEQVSLRQSMVCGKQSARPDRNAAALKENVVEGRNGPIAYYRFGRGTPVVLITGYRASIAEWNAYFLGELARHHEVIVFDNRGVGRSAGVAGRYGVNYGIPDMADDAADLIAALDLRRLTIVGWSMGGMIAQQLVTMPDRRFDRLVLLSTAPPGAHAVPLAAETDKVLSGGGGPDAFANVMGVLFPSNATSDAVRCFVGDMFAPPGYEETRIPDDVTAQQHRAMERWFADDEAATALRRVRLPTLIIAGADDEVLADANAVALNRLIAGSRLRIVDDAGHALMFQYPRQLGRMIDAFIGP
ncbi:alpha/beta fold hydrolase [Caballeronia humi]|uniref:Alpha/beta hydrolase n=1 Tax=Caballeronia humi TaxID=326474 RepID=A0A158FUV4_9BURK|nr:alpha/beta hydrolase [Caballeronia humi]SAL22950.1 alpha/beta hydrolase [Caballeronia humi]